MAGEVTPPGPLARVPGPHRPDTARAPGLRARRDAALVYRRPSPRGRFSMSSRSRPRKATVARRPRRFRPFVEPLEERWLPSTFTVNTTGASPFVLINPDGSTVTSLRAAINQVNAAPTDS